MRRAAASHEHRFHPQFRLNILQIGKLGRNEQTRYENS
jgi:hypothetical protein